MRDILSNLQEGYKIVPFNIVHYFLVNMNDIQRQTHDAHPNYKDLLETMASLGPSFTCLYEGHPIFMCGICHINPGVGEGWMIPDRTLPVHGRAFARRARKYYDQIGPQLGLRRLQFTVVARDVASKRFAQWLRFEVEGVLRSFAPNGENVLMMSRLY